VHQGCSVSVLVSSMSSLTCLEPPHCIPALGAHSRFHCAIVLPHVTGSFRTGHGSRGPWHPPSPCALAGVRPPAALASIRIASSGARSLSLIPPPTPLSCCILSPAHPGASSVSPRARRSLWRSHKRGGCVPHIPLCSIPLRDERNSLVLCARCSTGRYFRGGTMLTPLAPREQALRTRRSARIPAGKDRAEWAPQVPYIDGRRA
jgi:hypothetical protein